MPANTVVHLIDDDEGVRQGLGFLLGTAGLAVCVYESALHFLERAQNAQAGCVVTDVRMPGMDGLSLQKKLRELRPDLPVIVMTGHADIPLAVEAMKAGAVDFIEKPFHDEHILNAIRIALSRQSRSRQQDQETADTRSRLETLSPRERQVLEGLLAGHPNKTIAYDLELSPRTVEVHRANVMTKMAASSLSDLVRMAIAAGLQPSPKS
jgi:two-component system response regulator FixJ